jgi:hypothetical protein
MNKWGDIENKDDLPNLLNDELNFDKSPVV